MSSELTGSARLAEMVCDLGDVMFRISRGVACSNYSIEAALRHLEGIEGDKVELARGDLKGIHELLSGLRKDLDEVVGGPGVAK